MWPWWVWWWPVVTQQKRECAQAHSRVQLAASQFDEEQRKKQEVDREARHAARNVRMLMGAVLDRLGRKSDE